MFEGAWSPGSADWSGPLAVVILLLLLAALIGGLWPRPVPGPLTSAERSVARRSSWGRRVPLALGMAWGGLCFLGVGFIAFGPRVPRTSCCGLGTSPRAMVRGKTALGRGGEEHLAASGRRSVSRCRSRRRLGRAIRGLAQRRWDVPRVPP